MASSRSQLVIGYLSAFGKIILSTSSVSCTQALQGAIPGFQLSAARSLVQAVIYFIGGKLAGMDFKFKRETFPGLLYLGFLLLIYNVMYFGATVYLALTEAYGVLLIASFGSAFLQSRLIFDIDIKKSKTLSLLVCVVGIILTAQPSWLFNQLSRTSEMVSSDFENVSYTTHPMNMSSQYVTEVDKGEVVLGYILSVLGRIAMGLMYDINGIILKDVKPIVKVTYSAIFCLFGSVAFMFYMEDPVLMMDMTQFILVLGHGVLSAGTSFLFVQSAHYIPGATLSALYGFQVVVMLVYQYTIMHSIQPGNYNWIEVIGCVIIFFGSIISSLVDILMHRATSNEIP